MVVGCWEKNKEKEDDVYNLFEGAILCVEVSKICNKEDIKEFLRDRSLSLHITHTKKNLTYVEQCKINVKFVNSQKMKVNMKLQGGETVKMDEFLYVPQYVKNLLIFSSLVTKSGTMGDTNYKTKINKIASV